MRPIIDSGRLDSRYAGFVDVTSMSALIAAPLGADRVDWQRFISEARQRLGDRLLRIVVYDDGRAWYTGYLFPRVRIVVYTKQASSEIGQHNASGGVAALPVAGVVAVVVDIVVVILAAFGIYKLITWVDHAVEVWSAPVIEPVRQRNRAFWITMGLIGLGGLYLYTRGGRR
jgi:hypothetical protein